MTTRRAARISTLFATLLCVGSHAIAADVPGGKDHPLVGRFEGSTLVEYSVKAFDEMKMLQAPMDTSGHGNGYSALKAPMWLALEGKVTRLQYETPAARSSLEIMRNFKEALAAKKMELVFECADEACNSKGEALDSVYLKAAVFYKNDQRAPLSSGSPIRFALFKTASTTGAAYVAILLGNDRADLTNSFIVVTETKPMDTGKINYLNASELEKSIESTGKVDVYGIYFDFDKAVVKADSKPTLDEIAKLLISKPELKLNIIGHTDNKGQDAYNADLSKRRAASVVAALRTTYGIPAARLAGFGAGASKPIAANDTDENRAKNRRVELAKQ